MPLQNETEPVAKRPGKVFFCCCIFGVVLALYIKGSAYFYGRTLRLPGEDVSGFILATAGFLFVGALVVVGICGVLYHLIWQRRLSVLHVVGPVCIVASFLVPTGDLYLAGVKKRLLPINEAGYLAFAQEVRTAFGEEGGTYVALRYLEQTSEPAEKRRAEALVEILGQSVLADWPRELLTLAVERDSVLILRGSGMLGDLGVRIFDRAPAVIRPLEEVRSNPYLHNEQMLSPRVVLFRR